MYVHVTCIDSEHDSMTDQTFVKSLGQPNKVILAQNVLNCFVLMKARACELFTTRTFPQKSQSCV